jgi:hypothetical protein
MNSAENKCSICSEPALHSTQSGDLTTWLCCAHYSKMFKPKERCSHEPPDEYITEDHGIVNGRRVLVSYRITTPEESARIQVTINRIMRGSIQRQQLEEFKQQYPQTTNKKK